MVDEPIFPFRVAMISYYLPSESKIGAGHQAHHLANAMVGRGHEVTMFSDCTKPEDALYDHVLVRSDRDPKIVRFAARLRQLDFHSFDVLHAHGDDYLLRTKPVPHVRTMHGSCMAEAVHIRGLRNRARMAVLGLTELVASRVADETIAVSESTRRWVPCSGLIPNGIDADRFQHTAPSAQPSILFVGTYGNRKRGRLLMEHFAETVRSQVPGVELWMVCEDAPSAPGVQILGRVSDIELADLYSRAWVFCLPSSYEGFGIPYAEAMAAGVPVVATPNPGAMEVLDRGRCGLIVEPEQLGPSIVRLLRDRPERERLATLGRSKSRIYQLDAVAASYEALYTRLLHDRALRRDSPLRGRP